MSEVIVWKRIYTVDEWCKEHPNDEYVCVKEYNNITKIQEDKYKDGTTLRIYSYKDGCYEMELLDKDGRPIDGVMECPEDDN